MPTAFFIRDDVAPILFPPLTPLKFYKLYPEDFAIVSLPTGPPGKPATFNHFTHPNPDFFSAVEYSVRDTITGRIFVLTTHPENYIRFGSGSIWVITFVSFTT